MHLLLLCEMLTMVSYLRMESLLVLCAEVTPLGAKVQCHATHRRDAEFIQKTVSNIGNLSSVRLCFSPINACFCLCDGQTDDFISVRAWSVSK